MVDQLTVRDALQGYLDRQGRLTEAEADGCLRPSTLAELRRFLPRVTEVTMADGSRLGDAVYCEVKPSQLRAALAAYRAEPGKPHHGTGRRKLPSQATLRNVTSYMRMFMVTADADLGLDRACPMLALRTRDVVGRRQREARTYLTPEQVDALLAEISPHYRHVTALLSESGLRSGEARGLLWGDLAEAGFHVTAQASADGKRRARPKTASSIRFVAYTTQTKALFEAQRRWVESTYGPEALRPGCPVFPTKSGRFIGASNLASAVSEAAERAGLPAASPHSLRHAVAKALMRTGTSPDVVAAVLGHASTQTTVSIYSDPSASDAEKRAAMKRAFG